MKCFDIVKDIFRAKLFKVEIHLHHVLLFIYSGCILAAVARSFNLLLPLQLSTSQSSLKRQDLTSSLWSSIITLGFFPELKRNHLVLCCRSSWHSSGYTGLVAQLSLVVVSVMNVSVSPVCPAPLSTSTQVQNSIDQQISRFGSLSSENSSFLKKKITMENITRYNIMRQVTASQAQLVPVSRSLAVSYSNILIDAKKRTIFHTLLEEKQVNQMHLLS